MREVKMYQQGDSVYTMSHDGVPALHVVNEYGGIDLHVDPLSDDEKPLMQQVKDFIDRDPEPGDHKHHVMRVSAFERETLMALRNKALITTTPEYIENLRTDARELARMKSQAPSLTTIGEASALRAFLIRAMVRYPTDKWVMSTKEVTGWFENRDIIYKPDLAQDTHRIDVMTRETN